MRWTACVNAPYEGLIKHRINKQLLLHFQFGTLVVTDFHSIKLLSLKEFQSFPDYVPEFFRDKAAYGIAIDRGGDISYSTDGAVSLVTDFFVDDFNQKWSDEAHYTEDIKKVSDEVNFVTALENSRVQAVTLKNGYFGFCRKHPAPMHYGRINRNAHILSDSNEIIYGSEIKRVYVNTSPTLINIKDSSIFRIETN
jgi:hypothetical protein